MRAAKCPPSSQIKPAVARHACSQADTAARFPHPLYAIVAQVALVNRARTPDGATDRPFRIVNKFLVGKDFDAGKMGVQCTDRLVDRLLLHPRLRSQDVR